MVMQAVFETRLKDTAMAVPLMCCAADMLFVPSRKQVVLVGQPSLEFENMLAAAHASYDPNTTVSIKPTEFDRAHDLSNDRIVTVDLVRMIDMRA